MGEIPPIGPSTLPPPSSPNPRKELALALRTCIDTLQRPSSDPKDVANSIVSLANCIKRVQSGD